MSPQDPDDGRRDEARPPLRRWQAPSGRRGATDRRARSGSRAGIVIVVGCPTATCDGHLRFGGSAPTPTPDGSGLVAACATCRGTYALVNGDVAVHHATG